MKPPPPRTKLLWLGVDLDQTLARGVWSPDNPTSDIGEPIWENVSKLRAAAAEGFKPVISTSRAWTDYEAIETWLNFHDIPWRSIVCGKLLVHHLIDDRSFDPTAASWSDPLTSEETWAVGVFEGEGCIRVEETGVALIICMCDRDVVDRFAKLYGLNVWTDHRHAKNPKHQDAYICAIRRRKEVKKVLPRWLPYLGERRAARARECLERIEELDRKAAEPKKKAPRIPKHGTRNEYENHGCHCGECVSAHTKYCSEVYHRRKARREQAAVLDEDHAEDPPVIYNPPGTYLDAPLGYADTWTPGSRPSYYDYYARSHPPAV